ncbi:MAG TPA: hypothetical protein VGU23_03620, partial [Acidobacteriaceae bacterium]|nr:hypothetical protein [Acidobacteriaceae bacterium]
MLVLVVVGTVTLPMCILELAQAWRRATRRPTVPFGHTVRSAATKWIGTMLGFAGVLLAWCTLPEYARVSYRPLFDTLPIILPAVPPATALVILVTEWRLGPVPDHAWHFGLLAIGRWRKVDWMAIRDGALGWLVKGFFLPLNFCSLVEIVAQFRGNEAAILTAPWPAMVASITTMILAVLIVTIIPGYLFSSRLLGTEIRKIDHSWLGWGVTLSCYPPLLSGVFDHWFNYFPYRPNPVWMKPWAVLLQGMPVASYCVGGLIILVELVHYWGEATFGLRSSNLTHRGLITNGPYRFCKHPVYLAKCI